MGGIAVVHNLDGRPADPELLDRMLAAMAHRGPDGCGRWIDGPIAIGHLALHTTPESRGHPQPAADSEAGLALAFDGRIDNRDEIREALDARDAVIRRGDDAELALRACQCWGETAPERIAGDFVLALWSERSRELFCARDISGIAPLYYYCDGATFLAASELHALFEHPAVPREPNEGFIGEYLTGGLFNRAETLYRRIMRLEPAHLLRVRQGAAAARKYFELAPGAPIRYRDDREYADHFRAIFGAAVQCRMRSATAVGAELSGGLDSTSVTGMAARLIRDGAASVSGFATFSNLFDERGADERVYSDEAARFCDVENIRVHGETIDLPSYTGAIRKYRDFPGYPNSASFFALRRQAADRGIRVLLTGIGGDQWMSGTDYHYADLIMQGRFGDLIGAIARDGGSASRKMRRLIKKGIWPLAPEPMRRAIMRHIFRRSPFPSTIGSEFARRTGLAERIARSGRTPSGLSFGDAAIYEAFNDPFLAHAFEVSNRDAAACAIEERHPFHDIRLIRFFMDIPDEQRWRRGQIKHVLRNAMLGMIPEMVRRRADKAFFDGMFARTLENLGAARRFERMALESLGWVNGAEVRAAYAKLAVNSDGAVWPIWNTLAMELWIAEIFGAASKVRGATAIRLPGDSGSHTIAL